MTTEALDPPVSVVPVVGPELTLEDVQRLLNVKLAELLDTKLANIPRLNVEIQRLRVAVAVKGDKPSDDIYREMSLLNRMAKSVDLDEDPTADETLRLQTAAEKIEKAGISPAAARAIVRLFLSMKDAPIGPEPDADAGDEPGGDGPRTV